jgi:hypothetical protein
MHNECNPVSPTDNAMTDFESRKTRDIGRSRNRETSPFNRQCYDKTYLAALEALTFSQLTILFSLGPLGLVPWVNQFF